MTKAPPWVRRNRPLIAGDGRWGGSWRRGQRGRLARGVASGGEGGGSTRDDGARVLGSRAFERQAVTRESVRTTTALRTSARAARAARGMQVEPPHALHRVTLVVLREDAGDRSRVQSGPESWPASAVRRVLSVSACAASRRAPRSCAWWRRRDPAARDAPRLRRAGRRPSSQLLRPAGGGRPRRVSPLQGSLGSLVPCVPEATPEAPAAKETSYSVSRRWHRGKSAVDGNPCLFLHSRFVRPGVTIPGAMRSPCTSGSSRCAFAIVFALSCTHPHTLLTLPASVPVDATRPVVLHPFARAGLWRRRLRPSLDRPSPRVGHLGLHEIAQDP